jgi:hypothetical protein
MISTNTFQKKSLAELENLAKAYSDDNRSLQLLYQELVERQQRRQNHGKSEKVASRRCSCPFSAIGVAEF